MLSDILKTLYSSNGDIYQILNQSRYIIDIEKKSDFLLLFNTGFRLSTHKGVYMDLYFDLMNQEVIRSPQSPLPIKPPHLLGFIGVILDSKYLERAFNYFCVNIDSTKADFSDPDDLLKGVGLVNYSNIDEVVEKGSLLPVIEILDGNNEKQDHSTFQIINEEECIELPLRRTFGPTVFFDGIRFSEYNSGRYIRNAFNQNDNTYSSHWTCDACGGNSNTGCMSSNGECYR